MQLFLRGVRVTAADAREGETATRSSELTHLLDFLGGRHAAPALDHDRFDVRMDVAGLGSIAAPGPIMVGRWPFLAADP